MRMLVEKKQAIWAKCTLQQITLITFDKVSIIIYKRQN